MSGCSTCCSDVLSKHASAVIAMDVLCVSGLQAAPQEDAFGIGSDDEDNDIEDSMFSPVSHASAVSLQQTHTPPRAG